MSGGRSRWAIVGLVVLVIGGFVFPLLFFALAAWGAGALGLKLGERARALRRDSDAA